MTEFIAIKISQESANRLSADLSKIDEETSDLVREVANHYFGSNNDPAYTDLVFDDDCTKAQKEFEQNFSKTKIYQKIC